MLRLKQIDLFGFKSFSNRERLRFSGRGIAAVVGPNGCGKSNICDAVSWVLGEQSAKSLRGSRMNDVIFNGTKRRAPAGLATVTVTLVDPSSALDRLHGGNGRARFAHLPASKTPGEIAVTRKLFRNGKSQYILNGKVVRLRDVRDLFLGTGLGPSHYAIIEQGRIGRLLASRPLDRRAFVEEAAGVTRFKARRKLAEFKLASSELNLERVHDILKEVQRQAKALRRQAKRAERHTRYSKELQDALAVVFASRFRRLRAEQERLSSEVDEARAELALTSEEAERIESDYSEKRDREAELVEGLEAARDELSGLRIDEERMRERISQQARFISENSRHIEHGRREIETGAVRVLKLQEEVLNERQRVAAVLVETQELRTKLTAKDTAYADHEASIADRQQELEVCLTRSMESLQQLSDARAGLVPLEESLNALDRRLRNLAERSTETDHRLTEAAERRDELEDTANKIADKIQEQVTSCGNLGQAHKDRMKTLALVRQESQQLRAEVSRISARRDSVRDMLEHRAYTSEAVKDVFAALVHSPRSGVRPQGILADFLEVDEGYEKAVEQLLGEELEYVLVANWQAASHGAKLVREEIGGRVAFLVCPQPDFAASSPAGEIADAVPLSRHVRFVPPEGDWVPNAIPKLSEAYLVGECSVAEALAMQYPNRYFLLSNGIWFRGNVMHAGRKTSGGSLVLKRQMRVLGPQLVDAKRALETIQGEAEMVGQQAESEGMRLDKARETLQQLEKRSLAVEHSRSRARRQVKRLEKAKVSVREDLVVAQTDRKGTELRRDDLLSKGKRLEAVSRREQSILTELEEGMRDDRAELSRMQEERADLRTQAATLEERHRAHKSSLISAEALLAERQERLEDAERQLDGRRRENVRLAEANADLLRRIGSLSEEQDDLRLRIDGDSARLSVARTQTSTLIDTVQANRERVKKANDICSAKQVELARVEADLEHQTRGCFRDLDQPIDEVSERAPAHLRPEEVQDAEARHLELKRKIARLGPVNELAREEFEQVSERQEFLETQQEDLLDSIRNTRKALREIDAASREKFERAFDGINRHFREVFSTLFGGGVGEMRFSEPDNLSESGIEIVAQPPGKRLQNVALLSGGEKSLTVMALLMATFRFKPSPFCFLDEVDSQLDEANNLRLRRLLKEMAPETQFIVITHSKTTMEGAETLYGVTMGEAGVSKLVSVRMGDSAEAASADRNRESVLAASA